MEDRLRYMKRKSHNEAMRRLKDKNGVNSPVNKLEFKRIQNQIMTEIELGYL